MIIINKFLYDLKKIILSLIKGFYVYGCLVLIKSLKEHIYFVIFIVIIVSIFCSNPKTAFFSWAIVGLAALYSAIKAIYEGIINIKCYFLKINSEKKNLFLEKLGGNLFDLCLCLFGIFQSIKILTHITKITKSMSSALSVADDAAAAVSNTIKTLSKK